MSIVVLSLTGTCWVAYPIKEKIKVAFPSVTVMTYLPFASVEVPLDVPFSMTFTAGRGEPSSAFTVPDTVTSTKEPEFPDGLFDDSSLTSFGRACACTREVPARKHAKIK